jgi:hypothetical protein
VAGKSPAEPQLKIQCKFCTSTGSTALPASRHIAQKARRVCPQHQADRRCAVRVQHNKADSGTPQHLDCVCTPTDRAVMRTSRRRVLAKAKQRNFTSSAMPDQYEASSPEHMSRAARDISKNSYMYELCTASCIKHTRSCGVWLGGRVPERVAPIASHDASRAHHSDRQHRLRGIMGRRRASESIDLRATGHAFGCLQPQGRSLQATLEALPVTPGCDSCSTHPCSKVVCSFALLVVPIENTTPHHFAACWRPFNRWQAVSVPTAMPRICLDSKRFVRLFCGVVMR